MLPPILNMGQRGVFLNGRTLSLKNMRVVGRGFLLGNTMNDKMMEWTKMDFICQNINKDGQ